MSDSYTCRSGTRSTGRVSCKSTELKRFISIITIIIIIILAHQHKAAGRKNYARHTKLQTLHHILSAHLSAIHFVWVGNSKLNAKSKIELDDNF